MHSITKTAIYTKTECRDKCRLNELNKHYIKKTSDILKHPELAKISIE